MSDDLPHEVNSQQQGSTTKEVTALLEALLHAEEVEKQGLESDLARFGAAVVETLLHALESDNADIRYYAANALGRIGDHRAFEPLYQRLGDLDEDVRIAAAWALHALGTLSAPRLLRDLRSPDARVRSSVALLLGLLREPAAVEPLIGVLTDSSAEVRAQAVQALGHIGDRIAVEPLIVALGDEEHFVRIAIVKALGELGDAHAIAPLLLLLDDPDGRVRGWAADILCQFGDETVREPVARLLSDESLFARTRAAQALKHLRSG